MAVLLGLLRALAWVNDRLLPLGRAFAIGLLALMVAAILAQVFFRYGLGSALAWPEEAARFGMLWMTGLVAPLAYRRGGFVAIDMLERALPPRLGAALVVLLTLASLGVLLYALPLAAAHVQSGCLFRSASLSLPFTLRFALPIPLTGLDLTLCTRESPAFAVSSGWVRMPLAVSYASLYVGLQLLVLVNLELVLRGLAAMLGAEDRLPAIPVTDLASAD